MDYDVSFGSLNPSIRASPGAAFRLAVLGDFSGRASTGTVETGAALAARKPLRVDVDNLDDMLARLAPTLHLGFADEGEIEVPIASMDDFHPDQLVEALPLFEQLRALRARLQSRTTFDKAAKEVLSWANSDPLPRPPSRKARGGAIATDRKLSDFARLTGRPAAAEASVEDLIRRLVGPSIVPSTDSRQEALVARVDAALSDAMRRVLHHPEFQSAEALWRGVEFLVRRLETGARLQIVLYDITAEELAADLAAHDSLADTALHALLIDQPAADANAGPLAFIAGLYGFELSPPHADLLGRMAQLAGAAGAPFVAGIGPDSLQVPPHDWHPLVRSAWAALQALPAAVYLGLASPRFLLRMPYGKRTDPIDAFAFEEFTRQGGLAGMLWGNPALLVALLAGEAWLAGGKAMKLGSVNVVGDLPVYVYRDADGDQVALPCTERLFTERQAATVAGTGAIPVVSLRGRPEVRVAGFGSLAGAGLAGRWAPVDVAPPPPKPAPPPPPPPMAVPPPQPSPVAAAAEHDEVVEPLEEEEEEAEAPVPAETDEADLDALLASLNDDAPDPAAEPEPEPEPAAEAAAPVVAAPAPEPETDDLDALLASLSADPPQDDTEAELDALLASLK